MTYEVDFFEDRTKKYRTVRVEANDPVQIPFAITSRGEQIGRIQRYRSVEDVSGFRRFGPWTPWEGVTP